MNTMIRKAEARDSGALLKLLEAIAALHHAGRPDIFKAGGKKYTEQELADILRDENRPIFVADDGTGAVLGYAFCIVRESAETGVLNARKVLYLDDLYLNEAHRGHGLGRLLMDAVKEYGAQIGADTLELNVWSFNQKAAAFYAHLGFTPQKSTLEMPL